MPTPATSSESRIQQSCVEWFRNEFATQFTPRPLIAHVPNQNQHRLVSIGVYPGYADLVIHYHSGQTFFVEMKEPKPNKVPRDMQHPSQRKFETRVCELGFNYYLCDNLDEFKDICRSQIK